jgi:hypothetical protein
MRPLWSIPHWSPDAAKEEGVKNSNSKMTKPQITNVARVVLALHK